MTRSFPALGPLAAITFALSFVVSWTTPTTARSAVQSGADRRLADYDARVSRGSHRLAAALIARGHAPGTVIAGPRQEPTAEQRARIADLQALRGSVVS